MKRGTIAIALAAVAALATNANATLIPFSTGFEAAEGYTSGTQLATYPDWTGDGQDASGWQVTNSTVGGSGASSGTQWVLASGATASTSKFQWTVTPVTDFSTLPAVIGSADVKLASPASGTINRTGIAGLSMFDATVTFIGGISLIIDNQNLLGAVANQAFVELDFGDGTFELYDLGVNNLLNTYINLGLAVDFTTDTVYGFVNGVQLPDTGSAGGATDFHDFDMSLSTSSTAGGTRMRGGFDNYSVAQGTIVPEPMTLTLAIFGGLALLRRRRA